MKSAPQSVVSRWLSRFIFGSLLAVLLLTAIPYGTVSPWSEALFECAVFLLSALWLIEGAFSGRWFVREHLSLIPLLALAAYMYIQTLPLGAASEAGVSFSRTISADPFGTRLALYKFIALLLTGALLWRYMESERRLRYLIFSIILICVASALFGVARQAVQQPGGEFILPALPYRVGYGQFLNRNHFAALMEMGLGVTVGLVAAGGVSRERILYYIAFAIPLWVSLILSTSRGGVFSMLLQLLLLAVIAFEPREDRPTQDADANATSENLEPERSQIQIALQTKDANSKKAASRWRVRLVRAAFILCILLISSISVLWIGGDPLVSRIAAVHGEIGDYATAGRAGDNRREIWRTTWQLVRERPLTGVGFGAYSTAITRFHNASGEFVIGQAHNDYLELLASGGVVGVALAVGFCAWAGFYVRRALHVRAAYQHAAAVGALAGIFPVALHNLVEFGLHITINACVFVALIVIATLRECATPESQSGAAARRGRRALRRADIDDAPALLLKG